MELLQAARFFSGSRLASFVLAEVMTVSQGSDFVYAGNLQELKAKGRVVVRGRHRPILLVHGRVSGLDNRKAEFTRTRRQSSGVSPHRPFRRWNDACRREGLRVRNEISSADLIGRDRRDHPIVLGTMERCLAARRAPRHGPGCEWHPVGAVGIKAKGALRHASVKGLFTD
jgi:hypothetical protein